MHYSPKGGTHDSVLESVSLQAGKGYACYRSSYSFDIAPTGYTHSCDNFETQLDILIFLR